MRTNGVNGAEQTTNGNGTSHQKGRVGRPSTVAQHSSLVVAWLREDPTLSGAEIVRRIRLGGYTGGKSAIYELSSTTRCSSDPWSSTSWRRSATRPMAR